MAQEREASYEEMLPIWKRGLNFVYSYYAQLSDQGEHGKEGKINSLFAAMGGLEKTLNSGEFFASLKAQGMASLQKGGSALDINLNKVIKSQTNTFLQTAMEKLKIRDLIDYIDDGLRGEVSREYENRKLNTLLKEDASKEEKEYGNYLIGQLQNFVMIQGSIMAYQERAKETNKAYLHPAQNSSG